MDTWNYMSCGNGKVTITILLYELSETQFIQNLNLDDSELLFTIFIQFLLSYRNTHIMSHHWC
jgi:hypothetical protein